MKYVLTSVSLVFLSLTIACGGGSASMNNGPGAQIRVMQGSPDLGIVDVVVNGQVLTTNLGLQHNVFPIPTTSYSNVQAGTTHFQEFPAGTTSSARVDTHLPLSANTFYTVLTVGEESTGSLATLTLTDDHTAPASGQMKLRLVHGASTVGTVAVYTTANPTDPVPATPTLPAFAYKSTSSYLQFAASGVEVCVNPAGVVPASMTRCLLSVQYLPASQPQTSTMLFLDPCSNPSAPPGSFTKLVVFASLPY
jgi:hypothetical protein